MPAPQQSCLFFFSFAFLKGGGGLVALLCPLQIHLYCVKWVYNMTTTTLTPTNVIKS